MLLRNDLRYVVLDVETTGLDKKHDEVTQIGIVEYDISGKIIGEFSSYIKPSPEIQIQEMAELITGITKESLEKAPSWSEVYPQISSFFGETTVIIGHSIGFDIGMLEKYCELPHYEIIDTFPLAQSLIPYSPSYALEILAKNNIKISTKDIQFHDALADCHITGLFFFHLLEKLEELLNTFPYLGEILRRAINGFGSILSYNTENTHLLKEVPLLSAPVIPFSKTEREKPALPSGNWYIGETHLESVLDSISLYQSCIAFSHPAKASLAQKTYAKKGILTPLYEQIPFDTDLLHLFLTKTSFTDREVLCAIKYFFHAKEKHSSYHIVSYHDKMFVQALRIRMVREIRKRIYTQSDLFSAISIGTIPPHYNLVFFDKEWLFEGRKKWKYNQYDIYDLLQLIEAIIYKNALQNINTDKLVQLQNYVTIFMGVCNMDMVNLARDAQADVFSVDNFANNSYFYKSHQLWKQRQVHLSSCEGVYDADDMHLIIQMFDRLENILSNPFSVYRKRGNYFTWFTLQPSDIYTSFDDIQEFLEGHNVTYFSTQNSSLPTLPELPKNILPLPLTKWKEIKIGERPRICIIAPSKPAAQQLLVSLHKSDAYKDVFLGAENITGSTGKILQQVTGKNSYILIGGYAFCLQCISQGIYIDIICNLDIIKKDVNPFTDISYYAAKKIT